MNVASALSIVVAVIGIVIVILSLRIGSEPGWARHRALGAVALTAAIYAALDAVSTERSSDRTLVVAMHLQGATAALHAASWQAYVRQHLGQPWRRIDYVITGGLLVLSCLWFVPHLMDADRTTTLAVPWLGVTYRFREPSWVGSLAYVLEIASVGLPLAHYVRAMRSHVVDARLHALALVALLMAAINDSLVATQVIRAPMLLSLGFLAGVGALGLSLTRSFVHGAHEIERLSRTLELVVAARTRALVATEAALLRTEKMAALGQLSAGVAHEINNPAAAVDANLSYLRDALKKGALPHDACECLDESLEGVARITKIVAQLLDSGRAAAQARRGNGSASALRAVQKALASSRPRLGAHAVALEVSPSLFVRADESALVQVLVNLVVNAAQAFPSDRTCGQIEIRGMMREGRVAIDVIDDGPGMSNETRRRLFEPFFTTKPHGTGTGLGLSVSLGIVRSMGGDLQVRSSSSGTCMTIVLDAAEADPGSALVPTASSRRSVLLVDDDPGVRRAVARSLAATLDVAVADGVAEAHEVLAKRSFDVILCDIQMPEGGGRRLYDELAARSPEVGRRVILFTGGCPSEADRTFFEQRGVPLLQKPLVVEQLLELADRLCN